LARISSAVVAVKAVALDDRGVELLAPEDVLKGARDRGGAGARRAGDGDDWVLIDMESLRDLLVNFRRVRGPYSIVPEQGAGRKERRTEGLVLAGFILRW
jgi:hypothetical protein